MMKMSSLGGIDGILEPSFKDSSTSLKEASSNMEIEIDKKGCKCIVYKFDKQLGRAFKGGLFPFFAKKSGVCKVCDYIIFAERHNKLYALVIELKRGRSQTLPQLNAAKCFVDYVIATYQRVSKISTLCIVRKISIKQLKIRKKRTKMTEVKFDSQDHCFLETNKFYIASYLQ